jgi:prepilin-type N-terminal cleavage/methylation domain-containing protein
MKTRRGFTLVEMLVALAIISVLAAILTPVFISARASARATVCANNFHQVGMAMSIYSSDYDDVLVHANYRPGAIPDPSTDRTWVQVILPYVREFKVFKCPSDHTRPSDDSLFDPDLGPGDTYSRLYSASRRTNLGYNAYYLAPVYRINDQWTPIPRSFSNAADPSNTLLLADSVWDTDNGAPTGGGFYKIVPPCRYETRGTLVVDSFTNSNIPVLVTDQGWSLTEGAENYGHVWTWHRSSATSLRLDGSAKPLTIKHLMQGCEVRSGWSGQISDPFKYIWDLR